MDKTEELKIFLETFENLSPEGKIAAQSYISALKDKEGINNNNEE